MSNLHLDTYGVKKETETEKEFAEEPKTPHSPVCKVVRKGNEHMNPELPGLLENNQAWVHAVNKVDPDFFPSLGRGQNPHYLYIGCADARVDPGRLFGLGHGELFVHRNIGNMCCNELSFLSVLQYAVEFLEVPHIIVCGHYECGAVKNSLKRQDLGLIENWIRGIRDVYREHKGELDAVEDEEQRFRKLVEKNVIEQCLNVYKTAVVQRKRKEGNKGKYPFTTPRIHGFAFDPADGVLHKLDLGIDKMKDELDHIYALY